MSSPRANEVRALVDYFFVLDLDRCLIDTDQLYDVLTEVVKHYTAAKGREVELEIDATRWAGSDFDMIDYLAKATRLERESIKTDIPPLIIKGVADRNVLQPLAKEFLMLLHEKQFSYGILTYGHVWWQSVKVEASDLESIPYMVTRTPMKAHVLRKWQNGDGSFDIPLELAPRGIQAKALVLLDDKTVAFTDIPNGVVGVRVQPIRGLLPMQTGVLPKGIHSVRGFRELIETIAAGSVFRSS